MKQQSSSGLSSGQRAVLQLLRKAIRKAASLMAVGTLITCASFYDLILNIRPLPGLRVLYFSFREIPDEFPFIKIFVMSGSDLYYCSFSLFPLTEEKGTILYKPVQICVTVDQHPEKSPFADFLSVTSVI